MKRKLFPEYFLMKIRVFIVTALLFSTQLSAQTAIDSLTAALTNSTGRQRVNVLNTLTEQYFDLDSEKARRYCDEARELSAELGYSDGEAFAFSNLGELYGIAGENQKAIDVQLKALGMVNYNEDNKITGIIYNRLGFIYRTVGNYGESISAARVAYDILMNLNETGEASFALNMIGYGYWRTGVYDSSLVYFNAALRLREVLGDKELLAKSYNNIGVVFYQFADYERALDNYLNSLHLREELGDEKGISIVMSNIGKTYQDWGKMDEAMDYFMRSYDTAVKIDDNRAIGYALNNIGSIKELSGDYESALGYYEKSLELYGPVGEGGVILNLNCLATVHNNMGNYDKSREFSSKAFEEAARVGNLEGQATAFRNIGISYQKQKDYGQALDNISRSLNLSLKIVQRDLVRENYGTMSDIYTGMGDNDNAPALLPAV